MVERKRKIEKEMLVRRSTLDRSSNKSDGKIRPDFRGCGGHEDRLTLETTVPQGLGRDLRCESPEIKGVILTFE